MRTSYEGQTHEIYGEPTPQMIDEFIEAGLGIREDYEGERAYIMRANGRACGEAAVALSQEA